MLEDLFEIRTNNDRNGTISTGWNETLFWRDIRRLIAEGVVEAVAQPSHAESDFRERQYFRDIKTGELYVYVDGWERGSPEFRECLDTLR